MVSKKNHLSISKSLAMTDCDAGTESLDVDKKQMKLKREHSKADDPMLAEMRVIHREWETLQRQLFTSESRVSIYGRHGYKEVRCT